MRKNLYADLYKLEETHWWHKAKRELCMKFLQRIKRKGKVKILDIGCGTGGNIKAFASIGTVYGVDISPDAIAFCKKRGLCNANLGSAYSTKHKTSSLDAVTMLDVLEHVDDKRALRETKRILKTNGTLILTVPAYKSLWSKWDEALHHKRRYEKTQLMGVLQQQGFVIIKCTYVYSFLFVPVFLVRLVKSKIQSDEYSSDFTLNPRLINWLFLSLSRLEHRLINYMNIPFGTSIFCIAEKK